MNTTTHLVFNVAALGRESRRMAWAAAVGAVLPDAPIFLFYLFDRFVYGRRGVEVWSVDYFASSWQAVIDGLHSFPLILLGLALLWRVPWGRVFCLSLLLHSALDMPFHHDDAHRHFFPFADYRFASPLSYWDPRHHGAVGAAIELAVLVGASVVLVARSRSWKVALPLVLLCLAQAAMDVLFYLLGR
ncbi:MAG TPA: hypothetical protein VGR00_11385 [Thermoanaerobaculia bacterium]|nr:hypothetical protein [Thermoanaerobaculia bacterium]